MTPNKTSVMALSGVRFALAGLDAFKSTRTGDRLERSVLELLAGRHVLQMAVTLARPSRRIVAAGATVDALHSLSMVGLAAASPVHRRAALADAAVAGGLAAAGVLISLGWPAS